VRGPQRGNDVLGRRLGEALAGQQQDQVGVGEEFRPGLNRDGTPQAVARRWPPGDPEGWLRPGPAQARLAAGKLYAAGTIHGEWYPDFAPLDGDIVATEHWGISGFAHTDLDHKLRQQRIQHIIRA